MLSTQAFKNSYRILKVLRRFRKFGNRVVVCRGLGGQQQFASRARRLIVGGLHDLPDRALLFNIASNGPRQSGLVVGGERTNEPGVGAAGPPLPDGGAGVRRVDSPATLDPVEMTDRIP